MVAKVSFICYGYSFRYLKKRICSTFFTLSVQAWRCFFKWTWFLNFFFFPGLEVLRLPADLPRRQGGGGGTLLRRGSHNTPHGKVPGICLFKNTFQHLLSPKKASFLKDDFSNSVFCVAYTDSVHSDRRIEGVRMNSSYIFPIKIRKNIFFWTVSRPSPPLRRREIRELCGQRGTRRQNALRRGPNKGGLCGRPQARVDQPRRHWRGDFP